MKSKYAEKAKKIIKKILYITIATASKNGTPWNSPVYSAFDDKYNFFWASDQNGQHSKNIAENNKVFLVIYDSTVPEATGEGVYIQAKAYKLEKSKIKEENLKKPINFTEKILNGNLIKILISQLITGELKRKICPVAY